MVLSRAFLQATAENRESQGVRVDLPISLLHPEPQAKNTSVTPGTSRASICSESLSRETWSGRRGKRLREEKQMSGIPSEKGGRSQHCNGVWSLGPASNSVSGELMNPAE